LHPLESAAFPRRTPEAVGSKVIVNDPSQVLNGAPLGNVLVKSYVAVIVAALARTIPPNTSVEVTAKEH
jgi:hypothetical protein